MTWARVFALRPSETFPFVFYRHRRRMKGFYDFRRTAAQAFRQAGVSEGEIMKHCGWKTRSMFDRYTVINEADLAQAVAKRFSGTVTTQPAPAEPHGEALTSAPATSDPVAQLVEQRTFKEPGVFPSGSVPFRPSPLSSALTAT